MSKGVWNGIPEFEDMNPWEDFAEEIIDLAIVLLSVFVGYFMGRIT